MLEADIKDKKMFVADREDKKMLVANIKDKKMLEDKKECSWQTTKRSARQNKKKKIRRERHVTLFFFVTM